MIYYLFDNLDCVDRRRGRDGTGGETENTGEEEGERKGEGGNEDRDLVVVLLHALNYLLYV